MKITWFGHSAFRLDFADKVVLLDPFFTGNPAFEGRREQATEGVTHILVTHGHGDHVGDTVEIAKATGAKVVTNFELCMYLAKQGVENYDPMNTGGTTDQGGFAATLVRADHSSGLVEMDVNFPLGSANGVIVKAPGEPTVYHMGDTDIFGDMALIQEFYRPDIGIVPIGDRFTMNGCTAALACRRYFNFSVVLPCHYRTFPLLAQSADSFVESMAEDGGKVKVLDFGDSIEV